MITLLLFKVQEQTSTGLEQSSDPLPGETESQYIARQRALQEQVFYVLFFISFYCNHFY